MKTILILLLAMTSVLAQERYLPIRPSGATGQDVGIAPSSAATIGARFVGVGLISYTGVLSLSVTARTSAGVFTKQGVLIRTLWANQVRQAGVIQPGWDGLDNQGNTVATGDYVVKLQYNNVVYRWRGVLGNSSFDVANQSTMHRGFRRIRSMWAEGKKVFGGNGYAEGHPSQALFLTTAVQKRVEFLRDSKTGQATIHTTSDGTNVYWAGYDLFSDNKRLNWIFATKVSDNSLVTFSQGVSVSTAGGQAWGETYASSIDTVAGRLPANTSVYTGLAVQRSGNYLFASHGVRNRLQVLNKTTGAVVQSLAISSPGALAIDRGNDNVLWVTSGTTVTKRTINSDGTLSAALVTLPNLGKPMAMAVSVDGSTVAVCDGDTSGRVKGYSTSTGNLTWILGQKGGYYANPVVSTDKFYFDDISLGINDTFITFQDDGSMWVGDNGNYRSLHFSASRTYIEQIAYLENCYTTSVDQNDPSRLFAQYLEFSVSNYSSPGTGWQLVRNYRASVPSAYFENEYNRLQNIFMTGVFTDAATVSGHTYALLQRFSDKQWAVVELMPNAPLRFTGKLLPNANWVMLKDGSLAVQVINSARTLSTWNKQTLTSIDGSGNPVYSTSSAVATAPLTPNAPYDPSGFGDRFGFTSTGQLVTFYPGLFNAATGAGLGNHLGAVKNNDWLWQGHPATARSYRGDFPDDDYYDIGNDVNYPGGNMSVLNRSIYTTYHGENWKNGQVNKFFHFLDNGLLVGQFGVTQAESTSDPLKYPGMAGNVFGATAVASPNGRHYLVHGEEFGWSGLHIWEIDSLFTIGELTATAVVSPILGTGTDLLAGLPRQSAVPAGGVAGWSYTGAADSSAEFGGSFWRLRTSIRSYGRFRSPDLWMQFTKSNVTYTATRTLPVNTSLANWSLFGVLNLTGNNGNDRNLSETPSGGWYVDVLDAAGKIITRFYVKRDDSVSPSQASLFVNATSLVQTNEFGGALTKLSSNQPLMIMRTASGMQFSYAGYTASNLGVFESGADNTRPAQVRFTFSDKGIKRDRYLNIQRFTFFAN